MRDVRHWSEQPHFSVTIRGTTQILSAIQIRDLVNGWQIALDSEVSLHGHLGTAGDVYELLRSGARWSDVKLRFGVLQCPPEAPVPAEESSAVDKATECFECRLAWGIVLMGVAGFGAMLAYEASAWMWWIPCAGLAWIGAYLVSSHLHDHMSFSNFWIVFVLAAATTGGPLYWWIVDETARICAVISLVLTISLGLWTVDLRTVRSDWDDFQAALSIPVIAFAFSAWSKNWYVFLGSASVIVFFVSGYFLLMLILAALSPKGVARLKWWRWL